MNYNSVVASGVRTGTLPGAAAEGARLPLKCLNCGATTRIIKLIDDADVVEGILK